MQNVECAPTAIRYPVTNVKIGATTGVQAAAASFGSRLTV